MVESSKQGTGSHLGKPAYIRWPWIRASANGKEEDEMFKEFKAFATRGNVMDMAVGIVIGVAFGKIVTSLVDDIIMPPVGLLLSKVDFSNLFVNLSGGAYATLADAKKAGAATINYGVFVNTVINFLIVAFAIFLVVRMMNRWRAPDAVTTKDCPFCKSKIAVGATKCPMCTSEVGAG